ncbi:hypothetical protein MRX96_020214 [Rhipicephalus microplus]
MSSELDVDVPRRLKKEVAALTRDPPPGIYAAPDENDITRMHALVVGPSGTPYEGGFLLFHLVYPLEYPNKPPVVRFLTTDAGRVWLHPYLYESGEVSLSILGTFSGPQWSPERMTTTSTYRHEVVRVAVCDAVESCLDDGSSYPSALRGPVLKLFLEHYDSYEEYVKRHLRLRCAEICYPSICPLQVSHYETLLARLQDLKAKVEKRG